MPPPPPSTVTARAFMLPFPCNKTCAHVRAENVRFCCRFRWLRVVFHVLTQSASAAARGTPPTGKRLTDRRRNAMTRSATTNMPTIKIKGMCGKFKIACSPKRASAASSYRRAASCAVAKLLLVADPHAIPARRRRAVDSNLLLNVSWCPPGRKFGCWPFRVLFGCQGALTRDRAPYKLGELASDFTWLFLDSVSFFGQAFVSSIRLPTCVLRKSRSTGSQFFPCQTAEWFGPQLQVCGNGGAREIETGKSGAT
jgi:hypothetical protein